MNSIYYLTGFNNYFNRIVKKPGAAKIDDYTDFILKVDEAYNFIPNDYVNTSMVVNYEQSDGSSIPDDTDIDYILVADEMGNIKSRWFVIDRKRNLGGQFTLSLKRDLFADFFTAIQSSVCYVERGMLNLSDSLIYNSENMSFNQIKTAEYPLMDATQTPWIVIYFDRNQTESKTITSRADIIDNTELTYSLTEIQQLTTLYGDLLSASELTFDAYRYQSGDREAQTYRYSNISGYQKLSENNSISVFRQTQNLPQIVEEEFQAAATSLTSTLDNFFYSTKGVSNQQELINTLKRLNGKTIKDTDSDTLFTFNLAIGTEQPSYTVGLTTGLGTEATNIISNLSYMSVDTSYPSNTLRARYDVITATVSNVEVVNGMALSVSIPAATDRNQLTDAPWDMLAIPYNGDIWVRTSPTMRTSTLPNVARAIAQAAQAQMGDFVKDVQLLPYCPCMEYVRGDTLNLSNLTKGRNYVAISAENEGDANWGVWCNQSSFRVNITNSNPIINPQDPVEFKVNNECDMYRLVSPNYAGAFEFSATKNGGITGFEANCTYKPFQPYIHINPNFSRLYGRDFNDNRGLICGGNFSMPSMQNAWTNYQIQNKSYKESFERQVQNMETTYSIERDRQKLSAMLQAVSGTIGGGVTGGLIGGSGKGGAIGAAVGAAASMGANIFGAVKDLQYADQLFRESRSYAVDQFTYSLQNIKALPNTLSNIGAFDVNYKLYPFLEYYSCSDEEKEALREKIRYNGMTVMATSKLDKFLLGGEPKFIQGQLIRIEGESMDYHITAEIAAELHKGVYI